MAQPKCQNIRRRKVVRVKQHIRRTRRGTVIVRQYKRSLPC